MLAPIGSPCASFVCLMLYFSINELRYNVVVSPSTLGLIAKMISENGVWFSRFNNSEIRSDSGVMLSNGEMRPPST